MYCSCNSIDKLMLVWWWWSCDVQ